MHIIRSGLLVLTSGMFLAGCDAWWHLAVPRESQSTTTAKPTASSYYTSTKGALKIEISGGGRQTPHTNRVSAGTLSVFVSVSSSAPFMIHPANASISSCQTNFRPQNVSLEEQNDHGKKLRVIDRVAPGSADSAYSTGITKFRFDFANFKGCSRSWLEFPIRIGLGPIISGVDTLLVDDVVMDAAPGWIK